MMQKYYKIEFIPTAKGRFGSVHAIELWTEQQVTNYANKMVRNDLNSQKINFELQKTGVNMENYITESIKFDVIDVDRQKCLGQVIATVIS